MSIDDDIGQRIDVACAASGGFLAELIRAGRHGEVAVQQRVASALGALGAEVETRRYSPATVPMVEEFASASAMVTGEREVVVARQRGNGKGRSLILFAHPDSEPVRETEAWRHDPFAVTPVRQPR